MNYCVHDVTAKFAVWTAAAYFRTLYQQVIVIQLIIRIQLKLHLTCTLVCTHVFYNIVRHAFPGIKAQRIKVYRLHSLAKH